MSEPRDSEAAADALDAEGPVPATREPFPAAAPLSASDRFASTAATVGEFWTWGFSDLRANVVRGVLAEFLVARAVGATELVRSPWDDFDVRAPDGTRLEVKSSAYRQSWPQAGPSRIVFTRLAGRAWNADTRQRAAERSVRADVYVFAVQTVRDSASYDPLDVGQWEFYAVPARAVREAGTQSVGLAWVRKRAVPGPVAWNDLRDAVRRAGEAAALRPRAAG